MSDRLSERETLAVRVLVPDGGELKEPEKEQEESEMEEDDGDGEEQHDEKAEESEEDGEPAGENGENEEDEEEAEGEEDEEDEGEGEEGAEEEEDEDERSEKIAEEGTRLLHLNLDGLFLDLLGLEVDLDEVTLNLTAAPGDGKLLGNLLSAVGGLFDTPDLGELLGFGGDDEDGDGESRLGSLLPGLPSLSPMERARSVAGWLAGKIRELFGSILSSLPLEDLLSQFLEEVVSQLVDGGNGNGDEDAAGS